MLIEKRRFHGQVLGTFGGSQFLPRDDTATRACAATMIINLHSGSDNSMKRLRFNLLRLFPKSSEL